MILWEAKLCLDPKNKAILEKYPAFRNELINAMHALEENGLLNDEHREKLDKSPEGANEASILASKWISKQKKINLFFDQKVAEKRKIKLQLMLSVAAKDPSTRFERG